MAYLSRPILETASLQETPKNPIKKPRIRKTTQKKDGAILKNGQEKNGIQPKEKILSCVLALRDTVLFPNLSFPIFIGRKRSVTTIHYAKEHNQDIVFLAQKHAEVLEPDMKDLYTFGTLGKIEHHLTLSDHTVKAIIEGKERVKILEFIEEEGGLLKARVLIEPEPPYVQAEAEALMKVLLTEFETYVRGMKKHADTLLALSHIENPSHMADLIFSILPIKLEEKQQALETLSVIERLEKAIAMICVQTESLEQEKRIRERVKAQLEEHQKEYYLREQMKIIQKELEEFEDDKDELQMFEKKIQTTHLSKEAKEKASSELKKLKNMSALSAEAGVIRGYLEWILSIPWSKKKTKPKNLREAQTILDQDHYGLEKVKERILDFLAVQNRMTKVQGSILCFLGPPGVGKTSLAKSIARAMGRPFVRISLGGVRDEAEIRGHRRTYVGSMPGKIIQAMKRAKTTNPVILLDEMDKLGSDWRGDPASALLEVLDPEQNKTFGDHYLEVDYDLSNVMFIGTANSLSMPSPLLDRLEMIRIPGYTEDEKLSIAKQHLIPKQWAAHGLEPSACTVEDSVILELIQHYCREAGVRNLERELSNLARKAVRELETAKLDRKSKKSVSIHLENLKRYAGIPKFSFGMLETKDLVGVSTGLAWTEVGGDLLSIESLLVPGDGKMIITGKLGDVMQESIKAASSFLRSHAFSYGISEETLKKYDVHIHVPEGATPKDGPSAGIAILTAMVSLMTDIPVKRTVAMTGEITLRGRVLPIGGLKEKILAALRGGIETVIIPEENRKDLEEIPEHLLRKIKIIPVSYAEEVLPIALVREPKNRAPEGLLIFQEKNPDIQEEKNLTFC